MGARRPNSRTRRGLAEFFCVHGFRDHESRRAVSSSATADRRWLVTTHKSASEVPVSKGKTRRSDRYPAALPVRVQLLEPSGAGVIEFAETQPVNMPGGLLPLK